VRKSETGLSGVYIIEVDVYKDDRGWFSETYNTQKFSNLEIHTNFVQDNHSRSNRIGVLRGLHFQNNPKAQTKLVRCTRGAIFDVAVDLRKKSPTYLSWIGVELSEENQKQLFIPKGFAHGFVTLSDDVEIQYKVDEFYSKEHDRSIHYNDSQLNIAWPIDNPFLSEKDQNAPLLKDSDVNFDE